MAFVGREEERPSPGSHRVLDVLGESVILVRNRESQLRAFYNVCRHRGARLCRPEAASGPASAAIAGGIAAGRIVCPYHQWTYDLDGRLLAAPYLTTEPGFDKSVFSLYPIGVETWAALYSSTLPQPPRSPSPRRPAAYRTPPPLPPERPPHRPHHRIPGRRELEGDLRELQRVLSLRRRPPGAVRHRPGLQGPWRLEPRLGARHPPP